MTDTEQVKAEAEIDKWQEDCHRIADALAAGGRPGAAMLLCTTVAFVVGNHADDAELVKLGRELSNAGLLRLDELKGKG